MELFDIIKKDRAPTGRTVERGASLAEGDYHLIVHVWVRDSGGSYLISRRAPEKTFPGMWECTGGAAVAGETSLDAALREAYEELGIRLKPENGRVAASCFFEAISAVCDIWLFEQDVDLRDVRLQEGETCDARKTSPQEILALRKTGEFISVYDYVEWFFEAERKYL